MPEDGPWTKYAQQPAPTEGPWTKYAQQETPTPSAPASAPSPSTAGQKLFGVNPVSDTLSNVGSHLKNLVAGPYHAFADDPQNDTEQSVVKQGGGGMFGRYVGLPADRLLGASASMDSAQKAKGLTGDAKVQAYEDAVPIVGPWAKQIESDVQNKGVVPGLAGLATDAAAPIGLGKAASAARGLAPGIAEGALNISKNDRGFGKTPGRAILDETTGVRPSSIEKSAGSRLSQLNSNIDQMAQQHTAPVDITPAIEHVDQATQAAKLRNNVGGVKAIEPVKAQLTENPFRLPQPFAELPKTPHDAMFSTEAGETPEGIGYRNKLIKGPNGEDVGHLMSERRPNGDYQVTSSHIEPDFRGKGIGTSAYSKLIDEHAANGSQLVSDWDRSPAAEGVWRKLGEQGRVAGEEPGPRGNTIFRGQPTQDPLASLSRLQSAEGALNLKRGLRDQFVKNWNPDAGPQMAKDVARGASGVIDRQLDSALGPDFRNTNQRISSLIPVQDAAESIQRNAGIGQKIGGRLKAHTGALTGSVAGGMAGHAAGGPVGGLIGGAMGLIGPEVLASPTAQMTLARAVNSKLPSFIAPPLASGGIVAPIGKRSTEKRDSSE